VQNNEGDDPLHSNSGSAISPASPTTDIAVTTPTAKTITAATRSIANPRYNKAVTSPLILVIDATVVVIGPTISRLYITVTNTYESEIGDVLATYRII
jgi:hypothetical protein